MIRLPDSLAAWGGPAFGETLKREIQQLDAAHLPLQQGLSRTSYATDRPHTAVLLGVKDDARCIHARVGIFYAGIIAGCSCTDDPTPVDEVEEFCEVRVTIDKATAVATIALLEGTD